MSSFEGLREYPQEVERYPRLRYMGSKYRLLPWIHDVLAQLEFGSALDAFSGSGCVAYLLKTMGKRVIANDFLSFPHQIALGAIENARYRLSATHCAGLLRNRSGRRDFIERTFSGVFFTPEDLRFLDTVWSNLSSLPTRYHRALAIAALVRSCVKRQPRGVFTVAGDPDRYKDGRRDLRLSLRNHFLESVQLYNRVVWSNGQFNRAIRSDVMDLECGPVDLVYLDPPYVPRADDNCYIKRYHFLEGLASYWQEEGAEVLESSRVKKIAKRFTPFAYRRTCLEAFAGMFEKFARSTLVLSYSSNGYPDLKQLVAMMKNYKKQVHVFEKDHRYHFGTHANVSGERAAVREYLIVGVQACR